MVGRGNLMFSHRNNPYCELVVSDNAKILILKQITTGCPLCGRISRCICLCKDTILKQIIANFQL